MQTCLVHVLKTIVLDSDIYSHCTGHYNNFTEIYTYVNPINDHTCDPISLSKPATVKNLFFSILTINFSILTVTYCIVHAFNRYSIWCNIQYACILKTWYISIQDRLLVFSHFHDPTELHLVIM